MRVALIIEPDVIDVTDKRNALVNTVRHTRGVLNLDEEMAESGLLLATLSRPEDVDTVKAIDGIQEVSALGTKHAI